MEDRFDRTQRQAVAAIDRAKARQASARDRGRELELRIAELAHPCPPHDPRAEHGNLAEARDRAARAAASSERARRRAAEAEARRRSL
jgi:hypothetical protein